MRSEELAVIRELLQEQKSRLEAGLTSIAEDVVTDLHAPNEPLEAPSEALDKTLVIQEAEENILDQVREALRRIDDGEFGLCRKCRKEIPATRLQAILYTPWCVECSQKIARKG